MKAFFVFLLATTIVSVTLADLKPIREIQRELNASVIPPSRIIRGTPAKLGQFPYQIHLTIRDESSIVGYCGGSIIADQWVLTAGHCTAHKSPQGNVVNYFAFTVKAGSVNVNAPEQTKTVSNNNIHTHPGYNPDTLINDISLLKTDTPFDITSNLAPVALVPDNTNMEDYVGQSATSSGFGYITDSGPTTNILRYTNSLQIILFKTCKSQYSDSIPTTVFCVQDKTPPISAICSGDSGGPLTLGIAGQTRQVGIVSFGSTKGCDKAAQGFTDVEQFLVWIRQVTGLPL